MKRTPGASVVGLFLAASLLIAFMTSCNKKTASAPGPPPTRTVPAVQYTPRPNPPTPTLRPGMPTRRPSLPG